LIKNIAQITKKTTILNKYSVTGNARLVGSHNVFGNSPIPQNF